ncbi:GHMP kinase [Anaeroselena agilis]|uniref:GHMP kinase n=1 Tax=Anaeroselena agilis TaxID=3063788 RepID=A0ABU3NZ65_9FIRM|nr:GHMP kinase [Selenomonadales bacterium 4137-cl]
MMTATVRAPGSCGELVQGTLDGVNFLITCPVDLYAEVTVAPGPAGPAAAGDKTVTAVLRTWDYLGVAREPFAVAARSDLPQGKGMASSSADIAAACQAAALAAGRRLAAAEIADIALAIEPTDGIFFPGIVMFDHVRGLIRRPLGAPPPMNVLIFDAGGRIDTLEFNRRADLAALNAVKEDVVRRAVDLVSRGLATGDCALIGQAATLSALANQAILAKPALPDVIAIAGRHGAVGVNTAHSGTVLGVLFPGRPAPAAAEACRDDIVRACPGLRFLGVASLISGGLTVIEEGSR